MSKGKLTVVATPIGNLGDLSPRAIETLEQAEAWVVEDSRVSGILQSHFKLKRPMRVLNEHSGPHVIAGLLKELKEGKTLALVTDGGTPVVSDPGTLLIDECYDEGHEVDSVPGPSAVTNALCLSGFFGQRFAFLGFLGRKAGDMRKELQPFAESPLTLILFESPFRIEALLKECGAVLGERRYAICREMTKSFQQVIRAQLPEVPPESLMPRKGEITIVIEGRRKTQSHGKPREARRR